MLRSNAANCPQALPRIRTPSVKRGQYHPRRFFVISQARRLRAQIAPSSTPRHTGCRTAKRKSGLPSTPARCRSRYPIVRLLRRRTAPWESRPGSRRRPTRGLPWRWPGVAPRAARAIAKVLSLNSGHEGEYGEDLVASVASAAVEHSSPGARCRRWIAKRRPLPIASTS